MPEWIGEAALEMSAPRGLMVDGTLDIPRPGFGSVIDQAGWIIDEHLDACRRQADVGWTRLTRLARDSFVHEKWGAVQMEAGNSTQVPELARTKRRFIPADRCVGVGNDQHHREAHAVGSPVIG